MNSPQCPNCSTAIAGQYCSNCGQIQKDIRRFFLALVNEALDDVFSLNSRMWRTLVAILFRPGFLTTEYLRGRRVSYVQPVRLYFISSISFFLILGLINFFSPPPARNAVEVNLGSETSNEIVEQVQASSSLAEPSSTDLPSTEESNEDEKVDSLQRALSKIDKAFAEGEISVQTNLITEQQSRRLETHLHAQLKKAVELAYEGGGELVSKFLEVAPPVIFCLLPLFALLLKLLYVFKGVYYTEHFIYAVHNHCFIFLTLSFYTLAEISLRGFSTITSLLSLAVFVWIPVYLWISLKRVYGQGVIMTSLKYILIGICYTVLLGLGVIIGGSVGLATL